MCGNLNNHNNKDWLYFFSSICLCLETRHLHVLNLQQRSSPVRCPQVLRITIHNPRNIHWQNPWLNCLPKLRWGHRISGPKRLEVAMYFLAYNPTGNPNVFFVIIANHSLGHSFYFPSRFVLWTLNAILAKWNRIWRTLRFTKLHNSNAYLTSFSVVIQ